MKEREVQKVGMIIQCFLLIAGFTMLVKGADWFVEGASGIAEKFGIPQLVIGLTIVAMGTSMPEAAVSIAAALKGSADITIGNVVGSNLLNVLVILGLTAVVTTVSVSKSTVRYEIPFMIVITFLLLLLGVTGHQITFFEGVLLWGFFLVYLFYLLQMAKKNQKPKEEKEHHPMPLWRMIAGAVLGLVLIVWGSDVSVDAASAIARTLGLSERIIGLTIVALGTSLPELVTSVSAALKGKADIAIGNIVGSNIFNILFVVGTTALVTPVSFTVNFVPDTLLSAASCMLLWLFVWHRQQLTRKGGITMLVSYSLYSLYLMFLS